MSEKKHTPGPWEIKDGRYIDSPSGWIADVLSYPAYRAATDNDSEEQKANARLIAAAPDLLEALEEIVARNEIQHWFNLDQARAAIAKAKGGK